MNTLSLVPAAGLSGLWNTLQSDWVAPIFFAIVGLVALKFIMSQAWTKLIIHVAICAVVGVLIFSGSAFFGKSGKLKGVAEKTVSDINAVQVYNGPISSIH